MPTQANPFRTGFIIIAHAPLASALKACAVHVFPEKEPLIGTFDVTPQTTLDNGLAPCLKIAGALQATQLLVITDIIGATPFNLSKKLIDTFANTSHTTKAIKLISGANMPMLMRALTYSHEPLGKLTLLAVEGAVKGVVDVSPTVDS